MYISYILYYVCYTNTVLDLLYKGKYIVTNPFLKTKAHSNLRIFNKPHFRHSKSVHYLLLLIMLIFIKNKFRPD